MRVCVVARDFPGAGGFPGGGEVSLRYLADFLAQADHEVYVLTRRRNRKTESLKNHGVTVIYGLSDPKIPPRPSLQTALNWSVNIPQLTGLIEYLKPDIVHSYSIDMLSRVQIALGEIPTPSIATINNHFITCPFLHLNPRGKICVHCDPQGLIECIGSRSIPPLAPLEKLLQLVRRSIVSRYDHLAVLSEAHRRILIHNGFTPSRISVVPNFLDPADFRARAEQYQGELSQHLKIRKGDRVVSFVGHLRSQKGAAYLIKAAPEILRHFPETRILIIGPGPERNTLIRLANSLGITRNVQFISYIENEKIPALYALSTVFAFPSIWSEPFGRVIIEAMAVGTPVVATAVGGIPEIIEHEKNGILVPPGDPAALAESTISLLGDPEKCARIGEQGKKTVDTKYTPEVVGPRVLEIYNSILNQAQ